MLTEKEIIDFSEKKRNFMQTYLEISIILGIDEDVLFAVTHGSSFYPEVVQAVREWIE